MQRKGYVYTVDERAGRGYWSSADEETPPGHGQWRLAALVVAGLLLLAAGFAAGAVWAERRRPADDATRPPAAIVATTPTADLTDVPGDDVPGLPRFPGADRVEYRQVMDGDLIETEVEYVVASDLEVVHNFYRDVFDEEGWKVADLGVYQGEWTFFVIKEAREALLEIESRGALIEIEIEITEPMTGTALDQP